MHFRIPIISLLACAALALSGCTSLAGAALSSVVSASRPVAVVQDKVVIEGTRALIIAHNAFQGAIAAVNPLVTNRTLTPNQVTLYETLVNQGDRLLSGADTALTVEQRAASVLLLVGQIDSIRAAAQKGGG